MDLVHQLKFQQECCIKEEGGGDERGKGRGEENEGGGVEGRDRVYL